MILSPTFFPGAHSGVCLPAPLSAPKKPAIFGEVEIFWGFSFRGKRERVYLLFFDAGVAYLRYKKGRRITARRRRESLCSLFSISGDFHGTISSQDIFVLLLVLLFFFRL
jgi:hypothetical protein